MIKEAASLKDILEWYVESGVDETCGDVVFAAIGEEKKDISVVRQATTKLAQTTGSACQSAKDVCAKTETLDELKIKVEEFDGCALKMTASNTVFGDGNPHAKVVFVGEAPGADEDRIGVPFVGRSGQLLDKMLATIGLDRTSCYITNILPWRPPGNRTPLDSEIAVCLPFLQRQIDIIDPDFIFMLGGSAANALLNKAETISKLRGHWFEYEKANGEKAMVLASFHPAYLLRTPGQKAKAWADLLRLRLKLKEQKN